MNRSKGVTPVIATVLLITISVAATGTAYTFIQNAQDSQKQSYYEQFNSQQIEQGTDMDIETIYNLSNGKAAMVVRNTGRLRLMLDDGDQKVLGLIVDGRIVQDASGNPGWSYLNGDPDSGTTFLAPSEAITLETEEDFPAVGSQKEFSLTGRYGTNTYHTCYEASPPDEMC